MKIEPIFKTTLAEDMPSGSQGQPSHKKGAEVVASCVIYSKKLGKFGMVIPNPVFFYLNYAEQNIQESTALLLSINSSNAEWHMYGPNDTFSQDKFRNLDKNKLYEYLQKAISIPIFLFTALEAYTNQLIPKDYIYRKSSKFLFYKFSKKMNKPEIERKLSTDEKLTKIFPELKNKQIKSTLLWSKYIELKKIRNNLIHLKTGDEGSIVAYNDLFRELVDIDNVALFNATKQIMEFYLPNYFAQ